MNRLVMRAFCVFGKVPPQTLNSGATQKRKPEEDEEKGNGGE